ncbi:unnamed protein product [Discosporangium mesarthrocarpum]
MSMSWIFSKDQPEGTSAQAQTSTSSRSRWWSRQSTSPRSSFSKSGWTSKEDVEKLQGDSSESFFGESSETGKEGLKTASEEPGTIVLAQKTTSAALSKLGGGITSPLPDSEIVDRKKLEQKVPHGGKSTHPLKEEDSEQRVDPGLEAVGLAEKGKKPQREKKREKSKRRSNEDVGRGKATADEASNRRIRERAPRKRVDDKKRGTIPVHAPGHGSEKTLDPASSAVATPGTSLGASPFSAPRSPVDTSGFREPGNENALEEDNPSTPPVTKKPAKAPEPRPPASGPPRKTPSVKADRKTTSGKRGRKSELKIPKKLGGSSAVARSPAQGSTSTPVRDPETSGARPPTARLRTAAPASFSPGLMRPPATGKAKELASPTETSPCGGQYVGGSTEGPHSKQISLLSMTTNPIWHPEEKQIEEDAHKGEEDVHKGEEDAHKGEEDAHKGEQDAHKSDANQKANCSPAGLTLVTSGHLLSDLSSENSSGGEGDHPAKTTGTTAKAYADHLCVKSAKSKSREDSTPETKTVTDTNTDQQEGTVPVCGSTPASRPTPTNTLDTFDKRTTPPPTGEEPGFVGPMAAHQYKCHQDKTEGDAVPSMSQPNLLTGSVNDSSGTNGTIGGNGYAEPLPPGREALDSSCTQGSATLEATESPTDKGGNGDEDKDRDEDDIGDVGEDVGAPHHLPGVAFWRSKEEVLAGWDTFGQECPDAVIARSIQINGQLDFMQYLRVEGTVKGQIRSKGSIFVADTGLLQADLKGLQHICVEGEVVGDLVCESVDLRNSGKIRGSVTTAVLSIGPEATIFGPVQVVTSSPHNSMEGVREDRLKGCLPPLSAPLSGLSGRRTLGSRGGRPPPRRPNPNPNPNLSSNPHPKRHASGAKSHPSTEASGADPTRVMNVQRLASSGEGGAVGGGVERDGKVEELKMCDDEDELLLSDFSAGESPDESNYPPLF